MSFVEVPQGSHNMTVHPTGKYLYNSNSDLITSIAPAIEYIDILNPSAPVKAGERWTYRRARASARIARHHLQRRRHARLLGRAVAGRDHRRDRARVRPEVITRFLDPAINVWHQVRAVHAWTVTASS